MDGPDLLPLAASSAFVSLLWFKGRLSEAGLERAKAWRFDGRLLPRLLGELLSCELCVAFHASMAVSLVFHAAQALHAGLGVLLVNTLASASLVYLIVRGASKDEKDEDLAEAAAAVGPPSDRGDP